MKNSQSVAAAAAAAAAANVNSSQRVLGVSQITFNPLSKKLPCRCNLPAQDCVRLLR